MSLEVGQKAPDFTLPADGGRTVKLSEYRGRKVVVYFYPKDNTPGCTREAIEFSRLRKDFEETDARVIGISKDSARKHDNFKKKHDLAVDLGADEKGEALEAYGVWGKKKLYGRTFMGIERATFLVDRDGRIARIWRKVRVKGHADEVLAAAKEI